MRIWTKWMTLLVLTGSPAVSAWQDGDGQQSDDRLERMRKYASQMIAGMRQLGDWEAHSGLIVDSIESVYERNGWTSEPDLFSLELSRSVNEIPPWEIQERFNTVVGILSDRYVLDERQEKLMRRILLRENNDLFSRHADRIMSYAMEAVQTRAAGEPFTPDQVARWAELAEPVFMDARRSLEKSAREFSEVLDPEQQELLQADLAATRGRMQTIEALGQQWKAGNWNAADWGLDRDPIQNPDLAVAAAADPGAAAADGGNATPGEDAAPAPDQSEPVADAGRKADEARRPDPAATQDDEWTRYVKEFIARYKLDEEQQQRAWLFHKASKERGDAVRTRFDRTTRELPEPARAGERVAQLAKERDENLVRLFDRLKGRLESLPTRAQRRAAEAERPAKADAPARPTPVGKP